MKHMRIFDSVSDMETAAQSSTVDFIGLAYDNGEPVLNVHTHTPVLPSNLTISCSNNTVTITATNATTIEYNTDGSSTYTTYTQPFEISQTVTVYARATNTDGSITASQECQYVNPIDYTIPFYIEDISGSENTVQISKNNNSAPTLTIEKSTDGNTWTTMGTTSTTAITATVPANGKLYLRCNTSAWFSVVNYNNYYNTINTTGNCIMGGNILSLLYGSGFNGQTEFDSTVENHTFRNLLYQNTHITSANNIILPSNTKNNCYAGMFSGCTSLTTAPALPATTLANYCYHQMFYGCSALTSAPALAAMSIPDGGYREMFQNCTSLTTAPALPATSLTQNCYRNMFWGCSGLTTAPAILPATTLANYCYDCMFEDCTSLTTAPELPATTLVNYCYRNLFKNCSNLNYIKCLATSKSASDCTKDWVLNVPATGTFVKDANTTWSTGTAGIPEGWTVEDATE